MHNFDKSGQLPVDDEYDWNPVRFVKLYSPRTNPFLRGSVPPTKLPDETEIP
jgi:hypothetical protein